MSEIRERKPRPDPAPGTLTIRQVAQHIGVTLPTLYRWRYQRKGPPSMDFGDGRPGQLVRYRQADVDAWLDAHRTDGD